MKFQIKMFSKQHIVQNLERLEQQRQKTMQPKRHPIVQLRHGKSERQLKRQNRVFFIKYEIQVLFGKAKMFCENAKQTLMKAISGIQSQNFSPEQLNPIFTIPRPLVQRFIQELERYGSLDVKQIDEFINAYNHLFNEITSFNGQIKIYHDAYTFYADQHKNKWIPIKYPQKYEYSWFGRNLAVQHGKEIHRLLNKFQKMCNATQKQLIKQIAKKYKSYLNELKK